MEENIIRIENEIKNTRQLFEEIGVHTFLDEKLCKSIENLLKGYKELEEENKTLTDEYMIQKHLINADFLKDYIPISVIQNKIDELEHRIEKYREYTELGIETDVEWVENVADRETVKVLQELSEERNK